MSEALRQAGRQLANVAFNWAQRCGHTLTGDDVALLDKLRKEWDAALAQPPAPTAQPAKACEWTNCPTRVGDVCCFDRLDRIAKGAAQPVQQPGAEPMQGGMDNAELLAAWKNKLPGVEPSDAQLTAFAVGVEVGFSHARDLERQDWSRVHHALAKHGAHPGRTDDHLADVIDRALAAPAQRQPLSEAQIWEIGNTTLGQQGGWNVTFARAIEAAHGITAAPAAQKGEKL